MTSNSVQISWEQLHRHRRFLPQYPSEEVIRFAFGAFSQEPRARKALTLLDVGCGGGRHTAFLAAEGFNVTGLDFSRTGIEKTRSLLAGKRLEADLVAGDMRELPFEDDAFDGVVACASLYYADLAGMTKSVGEIRRVLKPGGSALVITRTLRDGRVALGNRLDANTVHLTDNSSNEGDMTMCFLGENDVARIFADFADLRVDLVEVTEGNREFLNSDWIIVARK